MEIPFCYTSALKLFLQHLFKWILYDFQVGISNLGLLSLSLIIGGYYAVKDRKANNTESYYFGQRSMAPVSWTTAGYLKYAHCLSSCWRIQYMVETLKLQYVFFYKCMFIAWSVGSSVRTLSWISAKIAAILALEFGVRMKLVLKMTLPKKITAKQQRGKETLEHCQLAVFFHRTIIRFLWSRKFAW